MYCTFGFTTLAVTAESLYFCDPHPAPGQEGPERGVRVELRLVEPQEHRGTIYASQRYVLDQAVFRADFLESVERGPGSRDRMHFHPAMRDNEPRSRVFDRALTEDPMGWLSGRLADAVRLLRDAGVADAERHEEAARQLRAELPLVVGTISTLLTKVRNGELARQPA
jgi:hypothetical protein